MSRAITGGCLWSAAVILMALPVVVAADFGGILRWTQYVAAIAIAVAGILAVASFFEPEQTRHSGKMLSLLAVILCWSLYGFAQTILISPAMVSFLSPGSASAYTDWIAPFVGASDLPARFSISIAPADSRHAAAVILLLVALAWATMRIFRTRRRISVLLSTICIAAAVEAGFGIYRIAMSENSIWGVEMAVGSFGTFVNRNNATLFMNLGLAASLGLLSWRLTALTGQEVEDHSFEVNDLMSLVSDRESAIGVVGATLCATGLVICGSRGGIVSAIGGTLLALGWVRQRRGSMTIPVVAGAIVLGILFLVVPLKLSMQSFRSFQIFSQADKTTLLRDGRLAHWRDGLDASTHHLPLGSGLSTYGYAYLPFQETGSRTWYQHADNLWLELLVEQGIVGVVLMISVLLLIARSLIRLGDSADPLDQGLRVTGWYALGVILVSQCFDFGLILPSNLFLVIIIYSTILTRESQTQAATKVGRKSLFLNRRDRWVQVGTALLAGVTLFFSVSVLRKDAERETLIRTASANLDAVRGDIVALKSWCGRLHDALDQDGDPAIADLLCDFEHHRVRLQEVIDSNPSSDEDAVAAFESTSPKNRRLEWNANGSEDVEGNEANKDSAYQVVLDAANQSLLGLPLGPDARKWQLYLDFVHRDEARRGEAIDQLALMHARSRAALFQLADLAGDSADYPRVASLLQSVIALSPRDSTRQALAMVQQWDQISPTDILRDDPKIWRAASPFLLANHGDDPDLMRQCKKQIRCQDCTSKQERSECEEIMGDISYRLGNEDSAFKHYQTSVDLRATDANLRYKYIRRLKDSGRRDDARFQARVAREVVPDDERFDDFIKKMASEDRMPNETESNPPLSPPS